MLLLVLVISGRAECISFFFQTDRIVDCIKIARQPNTIMQPKQVSFVFRLWPLICAQFFSYIVLFVWLEVSVCERFLTCGEVESTISCFVIPQAKNEQEILSRFVLVVRTNKRTISAGVKTTLSIARTA